MNTPTRPFIDRQQASRLEAAHAWRNRRYAEAQSRLQPASNSAVQAIADGYAIYAGPASPLNKAVGLGMSSAVTVADLDTMEAFYRQRQAQPRIELCPLADPTLVALLQERGYRLVAFLNLLLLPIPTEPLPIDLPAGATVRQASATEAATWIRVTTQGFEGVEQPSDTGMAIQAPTFHSEDAFSFLAWVGATSVAGGAMVIHDRVTELGGASTHPRHRRQGLQRALINARINHARALGCELAITLTSPGSDSQRNVERVGFRLAYTNCFLVGK